MPFVVDIRLQGTKQAVPLAVLRPAVEPIEHRLPGAELLGQVSPRRAGSPPPEHSLDEVSVIPARLPDPVVLHQERSNLRPLRVIELQTYAHPSRPCLSRGHRANFSAHLNLGTGSSSHPETGCQATGCRLQPDEAPLFSSFLT